MIDDTDTLILVYLTYNPGATTTTIGRDIYEPKTREDVHRADNRVRKKLKKLEKLKVVVVRDGRPKKYFTDQARVVRGQGLIRIFDENNEPWEMDVGDMFLAVSGIDKSLIIRPMENIWNGNEDEDGCPTSELQELI